MHERAARSVCPLDFEPQFGIEESIASRKGEHFLTAAGATVANEGSRKILGKTTDGTLISTCYDVADVTVPLDSVSQICDAGATVVFTDKGGHIEQADGTKEMFDRVGDTYMRTVLVERAPTFRRPGPCDP